MSLLTSHIQRLIDINKSMMETLHHQLSVQSAILQQLIRLGSSMGVDLFKITNHSNSKLHSSSNSTKNAIHDK